MEDRNIHISTTSLLKVGGIAIAAYLLFLVREILLALFVSLIIASIIEPLAHKFEQKKIPRAVATVLVYVGIFGVLGLVFTLLIPIIVRDLPQVFVQIQEYLLIVSNSPKLSFLHINDLILPSVIFSEGGAGQFSSFFSGVGEFFGGLFSFVLVLVFTFYLVIQKDPLRKILTSIVPDQYIGTVLDRVQKVQDTLGAWFRGQLLLSGIIGVVVFLGLTVLGVKYAAVIALLSAILEFAPYIGPIFASIPALLFAFMQGGLSFFLIVGAFYVIIQQIENHIVAPKVMQFAVGLNPIVSIIAVLVGAKFAGVLGALIAVPVATAIHVLLEDIFKKPSS